MGLCPLIAAGVSQTVTTDVVAFGSLWFEQRRAHWSLVVRGTTPVDLLLFVPIQFRQLSAFLAVGRTTTALVGP